MKAKSTAVTASLGFGIIQNDRPVVSDSAPNSAGTARILVVDGDPGARRLLSTRLGAANYRTESVETAQEALDACVRSRPHLVIADLELEPTDGLALLTELKSRWPELIVIVVTAHDALGNALKATQLGAFSFLVKPTEKSELLDHVNRAIAVSTFDRAGKDWRADMAARNRLMDERLAQANLAASSDLPLLLSGENGTGKELLARAIHAASRRRGKPFVAVSCRTAVESWLQCELFGRESGDADRPIGAFQSAGDGTLLVHEIGNLSPRLQLKFIAALGRVRLICTTSCDLRRLVDIGQFNRELFHRINVLPMEIPPLGRRREDIPLLVSHFLEQATDPKDDEKMYSVKDIESLATADWPENVRQLFDLVRQNVALSHGESAIEPLEFRLPTFDEAREKFARDYLAENLRMTEGNVSRSARLAKRNRTDFYKLLARYRLRPDDFKTASRVIHAEP